MVFFLIMTAPRICWADRWYEDYQRAVDLIDDGGCSREALQLLGAAVVDKPRPKMNARTIAVQYIDYLPYYQLARAHLACGDVASARHYLTGSRERGVAPVDLLDALDRAIVQAEREVSQQVEGDLDPEVLAAQVREANEVIRQARLLAAQIESRSSQESSRSLFLSQASALEQAERDLRIAEERIAEGSLKRDAALIESASASASAALDAYSGFHTRLLSLETMAATLTPTLLPPTSTPTSYAVRTSPPFRPTGTPTPNMPSDPPTATMGPAGSIAPSLRRGAGDYLRGDYAAVVEGLNPEGISTPRQRAAAHLLRAAAQYALFNIEGRTNDGTLEKVRTDLALCREADDSLQPDTALFSPDFVQLFRSAIPQPKD
jgi:hypothetical protein